MFGNIWSDFLPSSNANPVLQTDCEGASDVEDVVDFQKPVGDTLDLEPFRFSRCVGDVEVYCRDRIADFL
jgi:hypothetical protein